MWIVPTLIVHVVAGVSLYSRVRIDCCSVLRSITWGGIETGEATEMDKSVFESPHVPRGAQLGICILVVRIGRALGEADP